MTQSYILGLEVISTAAKKRAAQLDHVARHINHPAQFAALLEEHTRLQVARQLRHPFLLHWVHITSKADNNLAFII